MCVHTVAVPVGPEESVRSPGSGVRWLCLLS